jgi:tetratricopeptide (TPR) repeat protein
MFSLGGHKMTHSIDRQSASQLVPNPANGSEQIEALYHAANTAIGLHHYEQAFDLYRNALSVAQQIGNIEEAAWSLDRIATIYCYDLRDVQQGVAYYEQALQIAEQSGNKALVSMYWSELGAAYAQAQQYDQAIECYEQALNLARGAGDKEQEAGSLADLGSVYKAQGKLEEAIAFYQQAFDLFAQIDNKEAASLTADDLAETYAALGDEDKAAYYRRSEEEYDAMLFA